jgi:GNAT superfamily N-acetyltransferase
MRYYAIAYHYTWWRGDRLPALAVLPGFQASATQDVALLARLHQLDTGQVAARIAEGSRPYLALLDSVPAAYGWSATRTFGVAAAGIEWRLRPGERGLWDFVTLPEWRRRGIYPRLLQAILHTESAQAERFWIGHRADNPASMRGICAAGFQLIGITAHTPAGAWKQIVRGSQARAHANPMAAGMEFVESDDQDFPLADFSTLYR